MKRFLFFLLLSIPFYSVASNYYWVGGSGNWSNYATHWATTSGGLIFHVQQPTASDHVFFDVNSFPSTGDTVFITSTAYCKNFDCTGAINSAVFYGASGGLNVFGSFTLTYTIHWAYNGQLNFKAPTTGNTITSAGNFLMMVGFNGIGGSWILQDSLYIFRPTISNGTFYTNNQKITCSGITVGPGANAGIHLGTSVINIIGSNGWNAAPSPAVVFADSATFNYNGGQMSGAAFAGGGHLYHRLNFYNNSWITGNNTFHKFEIFGPVSSINNSSNTFDSLYLSTPGQEFIFPAGYTQTIINVLGGGGTCGAPTYIHSSQPTSQAFISKASGVVTLDYLQMVDIAASGGASFNTNYSITTNVTGWNVLSLTGHNMYWIGGTGNWNDPAHWSLTSGGSAYSCIPTQLDNVLFDANSFPTAGDTVKLNIAYGNCTDMNWTGATGNPVFDFSHSSGGMYIFGSLTMIHNMSAPNASFDFKATTYGHTIATGCHPIFGLSFTGHLGAWTLLDSLNCSQINVHAGTLYTNNNAISVNMFSILSYAGEGIHLGTSVIHFSDPYSNFSMWTADPSPVEVYGDSATFIFNSGTSNFDGGSHNYYKVDYSNVQYGNMMGHDVIQHMDGPYGVFTVLWYHTFDTLYLHNPGGTVTIDGALYINDTIAGGGNCNAYLNIVSYTPNTQALISKPSGNVNMDYLNMQDINATGGATFTTVNSNVVSNVSGWNFVTTNTSGNRYWVGGTGDWNDPAHWSNTSGGAGGACLPMSSDSVFFDVNSFPGIGDTVTISSTSVACHNMDWTGASGNPVFISTTTDVNDYGSLIFIPNMTLQSGPFYFRAIVPGQKIISGGQHIGTMNFDGVNGTWMLIDSLYTNGILIDNGTLYSMNQEVKTGFVTVNGSGGGIDFGTSNVTILYGDWNTGGTVNAANSVITFTGTFMQDFSGGNGNYNIVNFNCTADCSIHGDNIFHNVSGPTGNFAIYGNNTFDSLSFNNPGQSIMFASNYTQTIHNSLTAIATANNPLQIESSIPGQQSFISMPAGDTVCFNYITLQDQNAGGGGAFFAGLNSSSLGNNVGWQFNNCSPIFSDVWPGDANYDLIVDNTDILNIGIAYNQTGFTRPNASLTYVAQPCMDWATQFLSGVNVKAADCDGNGIVDINDTTAVSLNYGQTHPARFGPDSTSSTGPDLYFQFPVSVVAGTWVSVDIDLGTNTQAATNIYGTAFSVNYQSAQIVPGTMSASYLGSWLVSVGNNVHLEKDFYAQNKIDFGFSRTSHTNMSGNGRIVTITFQVAPFATGQLALSFSGITIVDNTGAIIPVNSIAGSAPIIVVTGTNGNDLVNGISVFPNPSSGKFNIDLGNAKLTDGTAIEVMNVSGSVVDVVYAEQKKNPAIDLSGLSDGIYFIRLYLNDGSVVMRKVVIQSGN